MSDTVPETAAPSLEARIARATVPLLDEIERLRSALEGLMPYRAHAKRCAYWMTETCTCGLRQKADVARRALAGADTGEG